MRCPTNPRHFLPLRSHTPSFSAGPLGALFLVGWRYDTNISQYSDGSEKQYNVKCRSIITRRHSQRLLLRSEISKAPSKQAWAW